MRSIIYFYLNGEFINLDFSEKGMPDPQTPVIQYLREQKQLTGTKQSCGTGDCGSCMVALAQRDINGITRLYAVNSCLLLLGMLDGKHLITIEGITNNGQLHPVQEVFLKRKGTQCGFCTPGVIMSSYVAYENGVCFTSNTIKEVLSGNLCRCTGYESIRQALLDLNHLEKEHTILDIVLPADNPKAFLWKGAMGYYIKPTTLESFLDYTNKYPHFPIVSGATDFSVKNTLEQPVNRPLIDVSDLKELKWKNTVNGCIAVGAGTTVEDFRKTILPFYPQTQDYLLSFASQSIRNRASLGGSLAGASSVGDIMPLLLALNAELELKTSEGSRIIHCKEFNTGYHTHILNEGEIVYSVRIPYPLSTRKLFAHKQSARKDMDISAVTFCISFDVIDNLLCHTLTGFGGLAPTPVCSKDLESFLNNKPFTEDTFKKAARLMPTFFSTISDVRGSASYRNQVASNLLIKCFLETYERQY